MYNIHMHACMPANHLSKAAHVCLFAFFFPSDIIKRVCITELYIYILYNHVMFSSSQKKKKSDVKTSCLTNYGRKDSEGLFLNHACQTIFFIV